jgi:N-acetyl-S-(2-succino)cysteine monooxygenase
MSIFVSLASQGWHPAALRAEGGDFGTPGALVAAARQVEEAGADAVLFGMPALTPVPPAAHSANRIRYDPLPLVGAAVGATTHIGLGAHWPFDIAEPFHVARVFATLDHLSGGRTAWVTGLTEAAALRDGFGYRPLVDDPDAAARRAAEFVAVTNDLFDSWEDRAFVADQTTGTFADPGRVHPIHHQGAFFTVRGPLNVPRPPQGRPVIVHWDGGRLALRRTAVSFADVIVVSPSSLSEAVQLRAALRTTAVEGRSDAPKVVATALLILAESDAAAQARAEALDAIQKFDALRLVGAPGTVAETMGRWIAAGACDGFDLRPAVMAEDIGPVAPLLEALRAVRPRSRGETLRAQLGLPRPASRFAAA